MSAAHKTIWSLLYFFIFTLLIIKNVNAALATANNAFEIMAKEWIPSSQTLTAVTDPEIVQLLSTLASQMALAL